MKNSASAAETLTALDAMKVRLTGVRQQYLKALVVVEEPQVKSVTVSRGSLGYVATLKTGDDVNEYVEEIRKRLTDMLDGNDVLHII